MKIALTVVVALGAALALSSSTAQARGQTARPRLGGVDLRRLSILGTEPFWSIDVTPARLVIKLPDDTTRTVPNPGPRVSSARAIWRAKTADGVEIEIILQRESCSDGMSDTNYPLKADVTVGEIRFTGCAETPRRR